MDEYSKFDELPAEELEDLMWEIYGEEMAAWSEAMDMMDKGIELG